MAEQTKEGKTYSLAAVLSLATGTLLSDFGEMHVLVEDVAGQHVFTHQLGNEQMVAGLRDELGQRLFASGAIEQLAGLTVVLK